MSNFNCEHCGAPCLDSPAGYTTGCEHYPPDIKQLPKIKPLVWERGNELIDEWTAETPFRKFRVIKLYHDKSAIVYMAPFECGVCPDFLDIEDTKAWCQSEYERRVRECLE